MEAQAFAGVPLPRAAHLAPLQVLPVQFLPDARRRIAAAPEQDLIAAVLQDAIHIYQKLRHLQGRSGRKMRRELEAWFSSDDDRLLFSFLNCCDVLNLNAGKIREYVGLCEKIFLV